MASLLSATRGPEALNFGEQRQEFSTARHLDDAPGNSWCPERSALISTASGWQTAVGVERAELLYARCQMALQLGA